ncbi:hypothetical protein O7632_19745 [Solwaraspora sp. WMMD406]|uniref:hypothetical protein n=1 Tax=Solwaraspora sp. WMMD406 TaxID=3016095 RepID=UPI0024171500|nr:hypothetical protein [Solwaraspora sp. WMMD406]MDG4766320.1 hypothetical protein [Solwaraspora sp. WMMD406]
MSKDVDSLGVSRRRFQRTWWLVPEALVLAVLSVGLYYSVAAATPVVTEEQRRADAASRIATAIEQSTTDEHAAHGHEVNADERMLCVVEVWHLESDDTATASGAGTAYGYYLCATGTPGTPYIRSRMNAGPIVARLTDPPELTVTKLDEDFRSQVEVMMPPQFVEQAFRGFTDPDRAETLRQRFERQISDAA